MHPQHLLKSPIFLATLVIGVSAACLGLIGIGWGLPYAGHPVSLHPDETLMLAAAIHADVLHGQLDTGLYNYGTGYLYAWSVAMRILDSWGLLGSDPRALFVVGRALSLVAYIGIAAALFLTARRLFGFACGLFAAASWIAAPLAVANAHYATTDMTATLWVVLCLCFCMQATSEPSRHQRWLYLATISAAVAAGCRYNAGLAALAPLALVLAQSGPLSQRMIRFGVLLIVCIASFLLICPAPLIHTAQWWRDVQFEMHHVQTGHGHLFTDTGNGLLYHLVKNLAEPHGWALIVMGFVGLIRCRSRLWPWLIVGCALLLLHGAAAVRFARYMLPLVPVLTFGSAAALSVVLERLSTNSPNRRGRLLFAAVAMACLAWPARVSTAWLMALLTPDPRVQAAAYIRQLPSQTTIGTATTPWFHSPTMSPAFGLSNARARRSAAGSLSPKWITTDTEWDTSVLSADYICLSDTETDDVIRIKYPAAVSFLDALDRSYTPVKTWTPEHYGLLGRLPHDMRYPFVRITLYRQRPLP